MSVLLSPLPPYILPYLPPLLRCGVPDLTGNYGLTNDTWGGLPVYESWNVTYSIADTERVSGGLQV